MNIPMFKICSFHEKLQNEIVSIKDIFKRDIYPNDFVNLCIKKFFINVDNLLSNDSRKTIINSSIIFLSFIFWNYEWIK